VAALAFQKQLHALSAAKPADRANISSHSSSIPSFSKVQFTAH
jgi:hypothetical protein